jgi:hypothetical protein
MAGCTLTSGCASGCALVSIRGSGRDGPNTWALATPAVMATTARISKLVFISFHCLSADRRSAARRVTWRMAGAFRRFRGTTKLPDRVRGGDCSRLIKSQNLRCSKPMSLGSCSVVNSGGQQKVHSARARDPPVAPNHRGRCLRFDLQGHAHHGQGQTAKANSDPHHHVGGPVERAKRCLKPGHSRTERPTCASQSISTKRSSRRAPCQQPGQPS